MANFLRFAAAAAARTAALDGAPNPEIGIVVVTGFGLVLVVLFVMILVLMLEGKIFSSIDQKKKNKNSSSSSDASGKTNVQKAANGAVAVEAGISQEVVAAIMAAISCMDTAAGRFEIRAITRAKGSRGAWNMAGSLDNENKN